MAGPRSRPSRTIHTSSRWVWRYLLARARCSSHWFSHVISRHLFPAQAHSCHVGKLWTPTRRLTSKFYAAVLLRNLVIYLSSCTMAATALSSASSRPWQPTKARAYSVISRSDFCPAAASGRVASLGERTPCWTPPQLLSTSLASSHRFPRSLARQPGCRCRAPVTAAAGPDSGGSGRVPGIETAPWNLLFDLRERETEWTDGNQVGDGG